MGSHRSCAHPLPSLLRAKTIMTEATVLAIENYENTDKIGISQNTKRAHQVLACALF
jgi:hypothetical protein